MLNRLVGAILTLVAAPLLGVLAAVVAASQGRPVLFSQLRSGREGEPFAILKFRTMREPSHPGEPDAGRITAVGGWLRRTSLDELPSLVNVARGEMALVGPRPLPVHYLRVYTPAQARRLDVRPGLTGWAQVHGRNALGWDERFALDTWYVEHRTRWLDLAILARTPLVVLGGRGIAHEGHATMPELVPLDEPGA